MDRPLKLAFLMEDTDLSGGVRITLAQADALIARGHEVVLVTKGLPLTWRRSRAEWRYVDDFSQLEDDGFDFIVGTFWTTVPAAFAFGKERALHLCQGYEGGFIQYADQKSQIDAVYALPIPKIVVTPHLVDVCRRFVDDVFYAGQIVDDEFYRERKEEDHEPLRVLLVGASQVEFKGIDVGYGAALHARFNGSPFELIRVSPWAPSNEEPMEHVAEFHVALSSDQMAKLVASCDIFLGPSRRDEGFGLPAAEAMASCLPAVLTRIPSFLSFAPTHDYALFATEDDPEELGDQLVALIDDHELRRKIGRSGRRVVEQFRARHTAERMEAYLLEKRDKSKR